MAVESNPIHMETQKINDSLDSRSTISPVEYAVIMRDLLTACKEKRIHASSSHSIYRKPDYRMRLPHTLIVTVFGMEISISSNGVACLTHQLENFQVSGSSLGDGGVWLRITSSLCELWLEIHVPMITDRQLQARTFVII